MECSIVLLILNFICVCLALAGNIASLTGYAWWKTSTHQDLGLWRECHMDVNNHMKCTILENLFSTEEIHLDRFIVLVLLIVSCGMIFLSLIIILCMFCCLKSKGCWYCGVVKVAMLMFLGGGAGLAALVFAEVRFEDNFRKHTRGWSNIVGWVGSGIGLVAFIFSCTMCFVKQKRGIPGGHVVVNPPYAPSRQSTGGVTKGYPLVNRGYQHGY